VYQACISGLEVYLKGMTSVGFLSRRHGHVAAAAAAAAAAVGRATPALSALLACLAVQTEV